LGGGGAQEGKQQQKTCKGQKGNRTTKARQDHNRKDKPTTAGNENTTTKQWGPNVLTFRALLWELV
jgi:hypothetical protein